MQIIMKYVHTYRKPMVIALCLMIVELIVELVQPVIMARIIDEGIIAQEMGTVYLYGALLLFLTLLAFVAGISSSFFAAKVSQGVGYDMRQNLYKNVQMFSIIKIQQFTTSTLLTRMTNDVTQVQGLLFAFMRIMLRAPLFIIFSVIMSFVINPMLATILLITLPILFTIMFFLMRKGLGLFRRVQGQIDTVNKIIRENLLAMKLVKAYHRITHEKKQFQKVNTQLKDDNKKALWTMEVVMPIVMLVMNIAMIAILWFGSVQLDTNQAQAGEVVAIVNYTTKMLASFGVFSFLLMNVTRGKASIDRIKEVLTEPGDDIVQRDTPRVEIQGAIAFNDVSFYYPSTSKPALKNITFKVNKGEKIGILGETGSGKTTLLHLIPYLYNVSSGSITIDHKPIEEWGNKVRDKITLVPQEGFLFSGTIRENIAWGNEHLSIEEVQEVAIASQIDSYIQTLPNGYNTLVGQRGINLSGGQKQRISIARALADQPSILLLDDSTSALDATTEKQVLEAIRKRQCTTIIVSQKISSVADANQIILLEKGQIKEIGTHQQLLQRSSLYQKMWQSQKKDGVLVNE